MKILRVSIYLAVGIGFAIGRYEKDRESPNPIAMMFVAIAWPIGFGLFIGRETKIMKEAIEQKEEKEK